MLMMNTSVFLLLGCLACCSAMLYRRDSDNLLKPDLMPVSSTVMPLPYYSVYGAEKKQFEEKNKARPHGRIALVTKEPE